MGQAIKNNARPLIAAAALAALAAGIWMGWSGREGASRGPRYVLVGMDALTWDIMDPMLDKGRLPNFQALIDRGVRARLKTLKSTYISASIWTTILTGKVPKHHGIDGWFTTKGFSKNSSHRTTKFLPQILGEHGIKTAAVGFMATWPAEEINGWIVSDLASYGRFKYANPQANRMVKSYRYLERIERVTWPPGLLSKIMPVMMAPNEVPRKVYQAVLPMTDEQWEEFKRIETLNSNDDLSLLKFSVVTDYNFHRAGLEIIQRHDPDAYMVYFEGPDIMEHFFWKYMEPSHFPEQVTQQGVARFGQAIQNYYVFMDTLLGEIVRACAKDAVIIVCSDHGMERVDFWGQDGIHSGQHRTSKPWGILVMSGPQIKQGAEIETPVVFDITPTLLHLAAVPVGRDMNGRVLESAIKDEFMAENPVRYIETHDKGMEKKKEIASPRDADIKQRLRAIGYLE